VGSLYDDLARPPLREASLAKGLVKPGGLWREIRVVAETGSTNADLIAAAEAGDPEGAVLVAEAQTAGRGRLGRSWVVPPRSGLTFSVLLRPAPAPAATWGWLPLLAGLATAEAAQAVAEIEVRLKWPNDLIAASGGKLAGLLAERAGEAVVVGVGLNVSARADELPGTAATSLVLAGAAVADRDTLLRAVLREIAERYVAWRDAGGDAEASGLRPAYAAACATIGQAVHVELPGGQTVRGEGVGVDERGQLIVAREGGTEVISAGDVIHVRTAGTAAS
jgi:BirA family biotin operon repressor/biotin-[acetyl-CoA-carboxylase] ligase